MNIDYWQELFSQNIVLREKDRQRAKTELNIFFSKRFYSNRLPQICFKNLICAQVIHHWLFDFQAVLCFTSCYFITVTILTQNACIYTKCFCTGKYPCVILSHRTSLALLFDVEIPTMVAYGQNGETGSCRRSGLLILGSGLTTPCGQNSSTMKLHLVVCCVIQMGHQLALGLVPFPSRNITHSFSGLQTKRQSTSGWAQVLLAFVKPRFLRVSGA